MQIRTIEWKNNCVRIIDQTALPGSLKYINIDDAAALWHAIKKLKVRGAPALGAAAALGVYLAVRDSRAKDFDSFESEIDKCVKYLGSSRPTAVNLFWGLEEMRRAALYNRDKPVARIKSILLKRALGIMQEDRAACRRIARFGSVLIRDDDNILTVCNAGALATIDYGTALGLIYYAKEQGKKFNVFAAETRPLLQGARLTAWELKKKKINVTLLCDSAVAALMSAGKVNKVIVGADRITANGDTANKIGTYNVAVIADYHGVPFYVAAPITSFDLALESGKGVPIEQRSAMEITHLLLKEPIAPKDSSAYNPAFDVTPHNLISAIVTDRGVIKPPFKENIKKVLSL